MPTPSFRAALDALAAINIPGITRSYALDQIPESLSRSQLPVLILAPMIDTARRRKYSEVEVTAPTHSGVVANYLITHLLLYTPLSGSKGAQSGLPGVVDLVDQYGITLQADPYLGGTLFYPLSYSVFIAPVQYAGIRYHAAQFWHTLSIAR
jgi:hypothetical protein